MRDEAAFYSFVAPMISGLSLATAWYFSFCGAFFVRFADKQCFTMSKNPKFKTGRSCA